MILTVFSNPNDSMVKQALGLCFKSTPVIMIPGTAASAWVTPFLPICQPLLFWKAKWSLKHSWCFFPHTFWSCSWERAGRQQATAGSARKERDGGFHRHPDLDLPVGSGSPWHHHRSHFMGIYVQYTCYTITSKNIDLSCPHTRALTLHLDVITLGIRLPSAIQNTSELIELTIALDGDEAINRLWNTKQWGPGWSAFSICAPFISFCIIESLCYRSSFIKLPSLWLQKYYLYWLWPAKQQKQKNTPPKHSMCTCTSDTVTDLKEGKAKTQVLILATMNTSSNI